MLRMRLSIVRPCTFCVLLSTEGLIYQLVRANISEVKPVSHFGGNRFMQTDPCEDVATRANFRGFGVVDLLWCYLGCPHSYCNCVSAEIACNH